MGNITGFKDENKDIYNNDKEYEIRNKYLNNKFPEINAKTVNGDLWNINDFKNKIILIHFWTIPCLPCLEMIDQLKDIYEKYKNRDDFKMFGVSGISYDIDLINSYIETKEINWTQLIDEGNYGNKPIFNEFDISTYPSFWIVGKSGNFISVDLSEINEVIRVLNKELK